MLVANSFDLWQKDTFFSAAEEVQRSADIMESTYRAWLRARREGLMPHQSDELGRELQMALGTAKWQLEEFEKAVRMSYRNHGDDVTICRHKQFVSAIEDQISNVEKALKESFDAEGKKPFRWVNLDEKECDDLALFLSGTSQSVTTGGATLGTDSFNTKEDSTPGPNVSLGIQILNQGKFLEEVGAGNVSPNCFVDQERDDISYQTDGVSSNRRTWISPKKSDAIEIVIDSDENHKNGLIEATPKEKGSKSFFLSSRAEDRNGAKGGVLSHSQSKMVYWINQRLRGGQRIQKQQQISMMLPVSSMRFVLALMLTIFLVVPFLVYST